MPEMKWTPGPWKAEVGKDAKLSFSDPRLPIAYVRATKNNNYAICGFFATFSEETQFANAHLSAAAPELYEALNRIVHDWDGEPEDIVEACSALARARGEKTDA